MASLIPGFEYDIFISYRQKDNKGDRWVSKFVETLKTELESTFKEDVSVYFDINPHDGLLETHDVDASLREKLKCLVFIPVISRTYCDPKSFAWEHEFMSFVEQSTGDRFGLKVNLPHGNVASRVLPVRIHDLEITDIKLCETVLGGVIRSVDFVYREAGVNRPLTPDDDEKKNLNNTRYRNQINKTANAIKEIISGLNSEQGKSTKEVSQIMNSWEKFDPDNSINGAGSAGKFSRKTKALRAIGLSMILIILGVSITYRILNVSKKNKTIAVYFLPSDNNDTSLKNISIVYTEAIYSKLYEVKSLTLRPRIDIHEFNETETSLKTIRRDFASDYLLYGNIRRSGNDITIWVELTSEKAKKDLWLKKYNWNKNMISQNTTEIVREIARNLKTRISPEELKLLNKEPTKNAEANMNYNYANAISYNAWSAFNKGNKYLESISYNSAIQTYDKAIKEDPQFTLAYAKRSIARSFGYYTGQLDSTHILKCLEDINKAIKIDKDLPEIQIAQGFYYYYCKKELDKALEYFSNAAKMNAGDYQPLFYMAMVYRRRGEWYQCQNLIKKIIALDPQDALCLTNIGMTYGYFHNYDSALLFHQKAIEVSPVWKAPYKNKIEIMLLKNNNFSEIRTLVDTAIQKTKSSFSYYEILIDIYEKKYSEALREAEKSKPSDFDFEGIKFLLLGDIHKYLKNSETAMVNYDSAIVRFNYDLKIDKNKPIIHSYIGLANAGAGNKETALKEGKKAVDLVKYNNFDKSDMILNLARIYTTVGEYDQASGVIDYFLQTKNFIPSCFSINLLETDPVWMPLLSLPEIKTMIRTYSK